MQNNGNLHVNFSLIARELGISVMTIYRVINNAPHVSEKMRAAVISRLNSYGFFSRSSLAHRRILFDFSDHPYLFWLGKKLQKFFPNTTESDHRKNSEEFFNAAASADTVVFCSNPSDAVIRKIKAENPELYTITLTTESCADVTITPDNKMMAMALWGAFFYGGNGISRLAAGWCSSSPALGQYSLFIAGAITGIGLLLLRSVKKSQI